MPDVVIVDDFTSRPTLGTVAPNGRPYLNYGMEIVSSPDVGLTPTSGTGALLYDTGHANATVGLTFTASGTGYPYGDGMWLRYTDADHFVSVVIGNQSVQVQVWHPMYHNIEADDPTYFNYGHVIGTWAVELAQGQSWSVEMDGPQYTVRQNGGIVGTCTDPAGLYLDVGVHGLRQYHPNPGTKTTMTSFSFAYDQAAHLRLEAGTAEAGRTASGAHLEAAGGETWLGYIDPFDTYATTAPNGETYEGTTNWSAPGGVLTPIVGGEHYLIVDTGDTTLDMRTRVMVGGENTGLVYRWTDPGTWVGVSINDQPGPQIADVYAFTRSGYSYAVVAHWPDVNPVTPCELRVTVNGDDLTVYINGVDIGPPATGTRNIGHNAGVTKAGLWANPYGTFDYLRWAPPTFAPPPEARADPDHVEAHAGTGDIELPPEPSTAGPAHLSAHAGEGYVVDTGDALVVAMGGAIRGPVAYGPRISQPGTYTPPIVARVYRLRDWRHPIVTLDQSFARTWQEQMGEAGSGSVTLLNDDPDLALIRDGDIIRFELYGEAAFSFVVTGRDKATIAPGEEHDETTTLTGPGLLAWLTSSMLIYPARQPPAQIHGPAFDRHIQGAPIEEDRIFSWASYAQLVDNDLYGPVVDLGPMPEPLPTDNGWPEGVVAQRIWVPAGALTGQVYYRVGFTCADPTVEIYIHAPLMDPIKVWLDGSLVADSPGGLDYGDVQVVGGDTSTLGTDQHVLCVWVNHLGGDAWLAAVGLGVDDEGEYTGQVMGTSTDWLAVAYPPSPPPVTAGAVIEAVLGEMNSRRYNPQMGVAFSIETDSDGNAWPPLPEITTKVGSTVWTFLQELSDYVEVYMAHNPNALYAWVAGGRGSERDVTLHGPTDPHDPDTSNLRALTHKRAT